MASYDEDRPNVATGTGKIPPKKSKNKPSSKPKTRDTGGYDWGDGNRVHSITAAQHEANKQGVATYGLKPNTPLDAPLSAGQAYQMALAQAGQQYDPQINAAKSLQTSAPGWYQDYLNRAVAQQTAAQQYAQPLLDTAKAGVQNQATPTPGLAEGSPQAAQDAQAAAGRSALAQLGYDTLAVVPAATNGYFAGQQATAARELPQAQSYLGSQVGQLVGQKGQAASAAYGSIRQGEQNASIARETLGLNTAKASQDAAYDAASLQQTAADKRAARAVSRKNTRDRIAAQDRRSIDAETKRTQAEQDKAEKDKQKKSAAIQKATGKVKTDVQNAVSAWNGFVGQETDDTSKPKDPVTGEYPARNLTPSDIKRILQGKGYDAGLIHVALLVRAKKPLDQAAVDYLHAKDPNVRVPREWLPKQSSGKLPRGNRPAAPKNDKSGYGDRPN